MTTRLRRAGLAALALTALTLPTPALAGQHGADHDREHHGSHHGRQGPTDMIAVIGDVPYSAAQTAELPGWLRRIDAARPAVTVHVGDIKSGSTPCTDAQLAQVHAILDASRTPLVYSPGDNEWTDCHRPAAGGNDPLQRLQRVREVFFPQPGRTLGTRPARVESQAYRGLPENVRWSLPGLELAALHVVGSDDDLAPWTGATGPTAAQTAEQAARSRGSQALVDEAFDRAERRRGSAVVLFCQADMFAPGDDVGAARAFGPLVRRIAARAGDFDGAVYLVNGDTHVFAADHPLTDPRFLDLYGADAAPNLTRITVQGAETAAEYLSLDPRRQHGRTTLTWTRVPLPTS